MPARPENGTLRLLLSEAGESRSEKVVLLPISPGSGAEVIAGSLIATAGQGSWRLLPAPSLATDPPAQRAWHRDLWLAMPAADREAVAAVIGSTAGYLAPVLAESARTVVFVREPLAAIGLMGEPLPKKRVLEQLEQSHPAEVPTRLLRVANPQSRALLAPWHDPTDLTISQGPPSDADRWREALFEDVLPHLEANSIEDAPGVARDLARALGGRPKQMTQAAKDAVDKGVPRAENPAHAELLLDLNWLDSELYDHCSGGAHAP